LPRTESHDEVAVIDPEDGLIRFPFTTSSLPEFRPKAEGCLRREKFHNLCVHLGRPLKMEEVAGAREDDFL